MPGTAASAGADLAAGSDLDGYSVAISPSEVTGGVTTTFTVAFTNDTGNTEPLNGASFLIQVSFHTVGNHQVSLRGLSVSPGETKRVKVEATVPITCNQAGFGWTSSAWENDGRFPGGKEILALTSGALTTHVTGGCARAYTLRISPSTITGGKPARLTFALRNSSSPAFSLSTAKFVAPAGFHVTHAALSLGARGGVRVTGGAVRLRGLRLRSGKTLVVTVTAVPAERCGSASYHWSSAARSGSRNLSVSLRSSRRSTRVGTTCALRFSTEPHNAVVSQHISGIDYAPSGPPVAVEILDGFGNIVKSSTNHVTIELQRNPGGAALAGTATVAASDGVASFSNLTLNRAENRYALSATSPNAARATSTTFDENDTANQCAQNVTCQTTLAAPASHFNVTATPDVTASNSGALAESIDVGTALHCAGYNQEDPNWYEFSMTSVNRTKVLDYVITHPMIPSGETMNEVVALTEFCFAAPYEFTTSSGAPAAPATLPDGSSGFVGLLPNCSGNASSATGPCVASKGSQPDPNNGLGYDIVLTINLPEGLAGDPHGRA